MFHQVSFVVLLLTVGHIANAQHVSFGTCPKVKLMETFDLTKYVGLWYQYASMPFFTESDLKCSHAQYGSLGDDTVSVLNTGINRLTGKEEMIKGFAKVVGTGSLAVVFFPGQSETQSNYNVIGTDYTSFAVVYSCDHILVGKLEFLYILTREGIPSEETIAAAMKVVKDNGISTKHIEVIPQNDCPAIIKA